MAKGRTWELWHGESSIVGKGKVYPGESIKVIEYSAFEKAIEALRFIAAGCLVPPDGGSPKFEDAIECAKDAIRELRTSEGSSE